MANDNEPKKEAVKKKTVVKKKATTASDIERAPVIIDGPCPGCEMDCSTCQVTGAQVLRQAACLTMKARSTEITRSLGTKAAEGDLQSAKILLALMMESTQGKTSARKPRQIRSMAQDLEAEPQWEEGGTKAGKESARGGLEQ